MNAIYDHGIYFISENACVQSGVIKIIFDQYWKYVSICKFLGVQNFNDSTNTKGAKQQRNWFQSKYCWTYGLCNHYRKDCCAKADGYQDAATLDNPMGGRNTNIAGWLLERMIQNQNGEIKSLFTLKSIGSSTAHSTSTFTLKANPGTSQHYIREVNSLKKSQIIRNKLTILLPDGSETPNTFQAHL